MCNLEKLNKEACEKNRVLLKDYHEIPSGSPNCRLLLRNVPLSGAALHNAKLVTKMNKGLSLYLQNHPLILHE